mmetsp:Transcript_19217/g.55123  ORF Transcript_19217/g.55123 Transcript_19217/m.55123 type:complete len:239 (-) Transcript_19217:59-775(-)
MIRAMLLTTPSGNSSSDEMSVVSKPGISNCSSSSPSRTISTNSSDRCKHRFLMSACFFSNAFLSSSKSLACSGFSSDGARQATCSASGIVLGPPGVVAVPCSDGVASVSAVAILLQALGVVALICGSSFPSKSRTIVAGMASSGFESLALEGLEMSGTGFSSSLDGKMTGFSLCVSVGFVTTCASISSCFAEAVTTSTGEIIAAEGGLVLLLALASCEEGLVFFLTGGEVVVSCFLVL